MGGFKRHGWREGGDGGSGRGKGASSRELVRVPYLSSRTERGRREWTGEGGKGRKDRRVEKREREARCARARVRALGRKGEKDGEREREGGREGGREGETERERDRETARDRERERERETDRDRDRDRDRDSGRLIRCETAWQTRPQAGEGAARCVAPALLSRCGALAPQNWPCWKSIKRMRGLCGAAAEPLPAALLSRCGAAETLRRN